MSATQNSMPVLIYDGMCSFCSRWAMRWKRQFGDRVEIISSQDAESRFPRIPPESYRQSVQLVLEGGQILDGAEAVVRVMAIGGLRRWPEWVYRHIPMAAPLAEAGYRVIARNRHKLGCSMGGADSCHLE